MKELLQPTTSYKPENPPLNPYLRAKAEWDQRIGSARVQAYNWRIAALGAMLLSLVLALGLIYQSSKSTVMPYVVKVDSAGMVESVGMAKQSNYTPQDKEIKYFISQFIQKIRSLPLDVVVAKQNWMTAYQFLKPAAAQKINELLRKEDLKAKLGTGETIQVTIKVITKKSGDSYEARWKEEVFKNGVLRETRNMTGFFTVEITPPTSEKEVLTNPLGIYYKDLFYSQEL